MTHRIVIGLLLVSVGLAAAETPVIAKWKNHARAALSLTFDDGLHDQYVHAVPLLRKYGFRATFYISANDILELFPALLSSGIY